MKNKGQHLIEFTVIGIVVFGICIISVFFFGDKLTALFKDNDSAEMFNKKRTAIKLNPNALLSNVAIELNGKSVNSPIEAAIREKLINGSYVQTSGSSGNITETMLILQKYIEQIEALIAEMPEGVQKDEFMAALNEYKKAINDYISLDSLVISGKEDPLVGLANKLDIAVNLDLEGDIAKNLNEKLQTLLSSSTDANLKKTLELFSTDMLNLGASIDFDVDSRIFQNLNLESPKVTFQNKIQGASNFIQNTIDRERDSGKKYNYNEMKAKLAATDFSKPESVKALIVTIKKIDNVSNAEELPILAEVEKLKAAYLESQQTLAQLIKNQMQASASMSAEDYLKMINVFTNGTYSELVPNTINSGSLCSALDGTVKDNSCSLP